MDKLMESIHGVPGMAESEQTVETIRQSEARFRELTDLLPQTVFEMDRDGALTFANRHGFDSYGYTPDDFSKGLTAVQMVVPEDREKARENIQRVLSGERLGGIEYTAQRKDGGTFPVVIFSSPVVYENNIVGLRGVIFDITERKQTEKQLRKSQAELLVKHEQLMILFAQVELAKKQWEKTLDCISDLVILVDREEKVRRCNGPVAELAGKPHDKLIGAEWKELLLTPEMDVISITETGGELYHRPSGRWFCLSTYPFTTGDGGGTAGAVVTLHDTTEIKQATTALEKAYADLKSTQAQMLQREKMASIGQLAAGIAHEINNPIGFVASNLGTLGKYVERFTDFIDAQTKALESLQTPETAEKLGMKRKELKLDYIIEDVKQLIKESVEGTDRVRKIVQDLKSFSRVDEAEYKHADINECMDSTMNIVWNELKYKATVHKEYGDIPLTRCYPQQLNQVFMNLLVNASHAIEKQGEITVRTWLEDENIYIAVADNGCGIPEENLSRIFEPFFTTKEVGMGTGLGLSILYDIVKKHKGEIAVESRVGKGTTFTVWIPVVDGR
ncbi:MAG: two-component system NtrC family sensor [Geobacteraceae bacterium]|nr:MAG: two-component system NtrC family sensor [Geobacteraceae bacterium]